MIFQNYHSYHKETIQQNIETFTGKLKIMVDTSEITRGLESKEKSRESKELQTSPSPNTTDINDNLKASGATLPVFLERLQGETTREWINRSYDNDPRFTKVTSSFLGGNQQEDDKEKTIVSEKFYFRGRLLTHKAPCPECKVDNYIDWFRYPEEHNMKLGCIRCRTKIDVYKAYSIKFIK